MDSSQKSDRGRSQQENRMSESATIFDSALDVAIRPKVASGASIGNPRAIRVLMYHRVLPDGVRGDPHQLWIPLRLFRRQMQFLVRRGYSAITFSDYVLFREGQLNLPRRPVIITFDDAYLETYTLVFPLLRELGLKAVIFVVADPSIRTSKWDKEHPGAVSALMSDMQILEMHAAGFEIGSHSLRHHNLCTLSPSEAWQEITRSRMTLEILLNAPVRTFSYPYGCLNSSVKRSVKEAGYAVAVAAWSGPPLFGQDEYEIRRSYIPADRWFPILRFAMRLSVPYQLYRWLIWQVRSLGERVLPRYR